MAGNTRGKLKEHFEGIHRNFEWIVHHINNSLSLIENQFSQLNDVSAVKLTPDELKIKIQEYPLYAGIISLSEGITILDGLAQQVYEKL